MLRVKETIHVGTKDGMRTITPEDLIEDGDDLVKGRENLFEAADGGDAKSVRVRRSGQSKTTPAKKTS